MSAIYEYTEGKMSGTKVAAFDMDDTLIYGNDNLLPNVKAKLHSLVKKGYNIVVFSNQRIIGDVKLKAKLKGLVKVLDIPMHIYCARSKKDDEYRKPEIGMIDLVPEKYGEIEFFVGDAASRPGDHSDCDLKFAENAKIPFFTPEEYFNLHPVIPRDKIVPSLDKSGTFDFLTMVILSGYPGAGKSTYATKILQASESDSKEFKDYVHINRDKKETMKKCLQSAKNELQEGHSVVIDNLNGHVDARAEFIKVGKEQGANIIGIHINTSLNQAYAWNSSRKNKISKIVYYTYRKRFDSLKMNEGFNEIFTVL